MKIKWRLWDLTRIRTGTATWRIRIANVIEWTDWPDVMHPDVYSYLVHTVSLYTGKEMTAYKSLDGFNFLVNGWLTPAMQDKRIICFCLLSSTLSLMPLKVWVVTKEDGEVLCGHCTCMTRLGEVCSHVVALPKLTLSLDANLVQLLYHAHGYQQHFEV